METVIHILIGTIAILHFYIAWLEMFAWETRGEKIFKSLPKNLFASTKTMAGNQGLYNGFLAAGLVWTFFIDDTQWTQNIRIFFLGCVAVAGVYGALTVEKKIFFIQTVPATITITLLFFHLDS